MLYVKYKENEKKLIFYKTTLHRIHILSAYKRSSKALKQETKFTYINRQQDELIITFI